jgi:hypothetical protein
VDRHDLQYAFILCPSVLEVSVQGSISLLETSPRRISVDLPVEETPKHAHTLAGSFVVKSAGGANTVELVAPYSYSAIMSLTIPLHSPTPPFILSLSVPRSPLQQTSEANMKKGNGFVF